MIKVHTRILILILITALFFLGGIILLWQAAQSGERLILTTRTSAREAVLDKIIESAGKPLKTFVFDNTFWDEMVRFVRTGDKNWGHDYIDAPLPGYDAQAAWVYRNDHTLVYTANILKEKSLDTLPLTRDEMKELLSKNPFSHFYANTPLGIMEFWGAPIQPTSDVGRKSPPQGYFFVGRLWTKEFIQSLSHLADGDVETSSQRPVAPVSMRDTIYFCKTIPGWNGRDVAWITFRQVDPLSLQIASQSMRTLILFMVFSVVIISLTSLTLFRWVSIPLESISQTLASEDPTFMKNVLGKNTEFGHMANLISQFFEQKAQLEEEILTRKMSEEKMESAISHIERAKKQWEDTFDNITDPIFIHDHEFRVIRANRAYMQVAGIPYSDIIGKPYYEVFPKTQGPLKGCLTTFVEQREGEEEYSFEGRTYRIRYFFTIDVSGEHECYIHIMEDITKLKSSFD